MAKGNAVRRNFVGMIRGCSKCGREITVTEKMAEYSKYVCTPCQSLQAAKYASRYPEKKKLWDKTYRSRVADKRAAKTKAWRERHPEKRAAHQAVHSALRKGTLIRLPCEECGEAKTHAHHEDYSRPLEVIWLCHTHHMARHYDLSARKGGDRP